MCGKLGQDSSADFGGWGLVGSSGPLNKTVVLMFKSSVWNHKQDDTALPLLVQFVCIQVKTNSFWNGFTKC